MLPQDRIGAVIYAILAILLLAAMTAASFIGWCFIGTHMATMPKCTDGSMGRFILELLACAAALLGLNVLRGRNGK